jgi:hypothetical protein
MENCTVTYNGVQCGAEGDEDILEEYIQDVNDSWTAPGYELTRDHQGEAHMCLSHMWLTNPI